jgi:N-acetylneuraminic acid mutarotase
MTIRDFSEFMDFGLGIDDTNGKIRGLAVDMPRPPVEVPGTGGQTILFGVQKVENVNDLHKVTGLSIEGSAAYGLFGGTDKFDFVNSSNFHSCSLFLCVTISVTNTSKHILAEKLAEPGPTLLGQGTDAANKRFRQEFGDLYIKGIETGGEYLAIVEIETHTDEEKRNISNKLASGGFFGVGGIDLATHFSQSFAQTTANQSLKIVSFEKGGAGSGAKQTVDVGELIAKAQDFPKQVLSAPAAYRVELQDYLAFDLPEPPNQVDLQNAKDVLEQCEAKRVTLLGILNDINFILSHPDEFESFDDSALGALSDTAASSLNTIKHSASQCLNDIKACRFDPIGVPDVGTLPKRKAATSPSGTWATKTSMPTARQDVGVVSALNGKLYAVGGGMTNGSHLATVEEYDPANNTWSTKTPMPTSRDGLAVTAASNGKIYAIGGLHQAVGEIAVVEEYDPIANSWATRSAMPTARNGLAATFASNGKIYAVGGDSGDNVGVTTVEEYDPTSDSWTTKAPMPTPRVALGLAGAANGKVYAIGGFLHGAALTTVEEYDPAMNSWVNKAPMPTARLEFGVATSSNGKIYVIGGSDGGANPHLANVEEYDPLTNSWAVKPAMPTGRASLGLAAAANGRLYAVGGINRTDLATVEEYTP